MSTSPPHDPQGFVLLKVGFAYASKLASDKVGFAYFLALVGAPFGAVPSRTSVRGAALRAPTLPTPASWLRNSIYFEQS